MQTHEFHLDFGLHTLFRLLECYDFETVLDIGSSEGEHGRFFRHFGKQVFSVDLSAGADYVGDCTKRVLEANWGDRNYELPPAAFRGEIKVTPKATQVNVP